MEYEIQRLCQQGKVMTAQVRHSRIVRAAMAIRQEHDEVRNRTVLVARVLSAGTATPPVPALYDANLVACSGDNWTIAGYERVIEDDGLQQMQMFGQAWIVRPAHLQDLVDAELKWGEANARAVEAEARLAALVGTK